MNPPDVELPQEPDWANWQSYCLRLAEGCDQRKVIQAMLDAGISTRRGIVCKHREEAYGKLPLRHLFPHSERAQDRCTPPPLYEQMEVEEQQRVASALRAAWAML